RRLVVVVRERPRAVGGCVVDGDRLVAGVGQRYRERERRRSRVALRRGHVGDRQRRRAVVVEDRRGGGDGRAQRGVRRAGERQAERLVALELRVAQHVHGDRARGGSRADRDRAAGRLVIVVRDRRRAVAGLVADGHGQRVDGGQVDGEVE